MRLKKLTKLIVSTTILTSMFGSTFASAATISQSSDSSTVEADENVLKIDVDDNGDLTYTLPKSYTSSELQEMEDRPFTWDNANVYFVMTDRFYNGDKSNDHSYERSTTEKDAANYENRQGTFHGGDLKGMTEKIEAGYFDDLGVNAIWVTAPYEQIHGALCGTGFKHYAYHGYYALDFSNMDANMGTEQDLENFIDTAHSHGIRVIFDIVMNHAGYADAYTANEYGFGKLASNWQEIYYNWSESQYKWYNDYVGEASSNGSQGMMDPNGDWSTNWWGPSWIRAIGSRFNGYTGSESDGDLTICTSGLPDFKTETTNDPGLPGILKVKWQKEGRYDKEMAELNNFFSTSGRQKNVANYIVKWLTDWVREYGVDGFRCDTAKHVELSNWNTLKEESVKALKEWRQNNPDKPGAQWTDDFWMTGEAWGHGVGKDGYYTSGGFDSMINFSYQGNENKSGASLESLYSDYANKINNDPSFNVLSYISSHDKGLGARSASAGTALLLTPGGVQTYYGDETGRDSAGVSGEQGWRSQMNWNNIKTDILSNWQKVGQFRRDHSAVGAGAHKQLGTSPYTFSRTYTNASKGIDDKVVISLPNAAGTYSVPVTGVFNDGDTVRDAYSEQEYVVSGGAVSVTCDSNGVILLESTGISKPTVGANPGSKNIYEATEVTLSSSKTVTGYYSLNGGAKKAFTNGDKITVGAGLSIGETATLVVSGTSSDGEEVETKTYVYTMAEKPSNNILIKAKSSKWTTAPNIYVYTSDSSETQLTGAWPGQAMTLGSDGYYTFEYEPNSEDENYSVRVIFNGSWGQDPGAQQPGYEVKGAMQYDNGTWTTIEPEVTTGSVTVKYVDEATNEVLDSKVLTGKVGTSYTTSPITIDGYTLSSTPSNATGTFAKTATTVTYYYIADEEPPVDKAPVVNSFIADKDNQVVGSNVTLTANATGSGTLQYKFIVQDAKGNWTKIKDYSTSNTAIWTTSSVGENTLYVDVKDISNGKVTREKLSYTVKAQTVVAPIVTSFTADKENQIVGTKVVLTANATGNGTLQYKFIVKDAKGNWTKIQDYSTSNTAVWTTALAGNNTLYVDVKDSNGKVTRKELAYTVKAKPVAPTVNSFITDKQSPQPTGTTVILKANATGSSKLQYKFLIKDSKGNWYVIQNYSTSNTAVWKTGATGDKTLYVDVKDTESGLVTRKQMSYTVGNVSSVNIGTISSNVQSPQNLGTAIAFNTEATGTGELQYKYSVSNGTTWTTIRDYESSAIALWIPTEVGSYTVKVEVKDSTGTVESKTLSYVIK